MELPCSHSYSRIHRGIDHQFVVCEEYIHTISKLWPEWISSKDRVLLQFLADLCKSLNKINELSIDDLYTLTEEEIINKFKNSKDLYIQKAWNNFINTDKVYTSNKLINDKYCVKVTSKPRYINPLVLKKGRIYNISKEAKNYIDEYLNLPKGGCYEYYDFDFKPY